MSTAIQRQQPVSIEIAGITKEQRELVKRTIVGQDITDDELSLFLHVAAASGLDPMRRQIHCVKLKGRLTFIADINGLQARAAREADFEGITYACVREKDEFKFNHAESDVEEHVSNPFNSGKPIGAWAIVRRKGMKPFVSLVRFDEYNNPTNDNWRSRPSVMIEKCAKSTALRLAYPEQLGSTYEQAELDREETEINPPPVVDEEHRARGKVTQDLKAALLAKVAPTAAPHMDAEGAAVRESGRVQAAKARAAANATPAAVVELKPVAVPAPATKPGLIVDVEPGETEEQAEKRTKATSPKAAKLSQWQRLVELGALYGKSEAQMASFCKARLTGKTRAQITESDVQALQQDLSLLAKPEPIDEVPPPTDADAGPEAAQ